MDPEDCRDLDDDLPRFPAFDPRPVPGELYSVYSGHPFTTCTVCSGGLLDRCYEVQKVFRGVECVFEMAVCHSCGETIAREFSAESLEALKGFLVAKFKPTCEPSHCHFCGFPRALFRDYTIVGACRGSSLIFPSIVMCEKCSESLQERLSQKTRDSQGDFIHEHFPGVPSDLDLSPTLGGVF